MRQGVRLRINGDYWQAVWYDSKGQRRGRSLGNRSELSKRKAQQECDRIAAELAVTPAARDCLGAIGVADWITHYLSLRKDLSGRSRSDVNTSAAYVLAYFTDEQPVSRIDRITRVDAEAWRAWLYTQGRIIGTGKAKSIEPMTESTVRKHCRNAKTMFNKAVEMNVLAFNPFDRLSSSVMESDKQWAELTDKQVDALIAAAPDRHWRCLIALCALAGLRRGEAYRMTWADVRFDQRRLIVRNEGAHTTKKRQREVMLDPKLERILTAAHSEAQPGEANVFTILGHNIEERFDRIVVAAGLVPWDHPLHTLRKWRATTWRNQYPESVVDAWLGHSLAVARRHYVRVPEAYYGQQNNTPDLSSLTTEQRDILLAALVKGRTETELRQLASADNQR